MIAAGGVLGVLFMIASIVAGIVLYFAPMLVAWMMKCRQIGVVVVVNLVFGWTIIGWVVALVIALWTEKPQPQPWQPMPPPYPYPYPPQQQWPQQPPMWHTDTATPPYGTTRFTTFNE